MEINLAALAVVRTYNIQQIMYLESQLQYFKHIYNFTFQL